MLKCTTIGVNKTYVGYTNNIKKRLSKHNSSKGAKSTKGHNWILIYKKKFINKSEIDNNSEKVRRNIIETLIDRKIKKIEILLKVK